ncbi:MAG: hypothetical protein AABO57_15560 [Acidobacteriota bacterium]
MLLPVESIKPAQPRLKLGHISFAITTESLFGFFHLRRHISAERKVDADALLDCELLGRTAFFSRGFIPAFA